ncbi:hypothetical protein, partial [Steroidobacter sp.]|uniref:hypothetical protein n=1 Tax=Steroidobacter sp. TaxID=1978227 RepID=UPI001A52B619
MTTRISSLGQVSLALSIAATLGLAGCGGTVGNGGSNPLASSSSPSTGGTVTVPSSSTPTTTTPATSNPTPGGTANAIGDPAVATANNAVLTNTRLVSYTLSNGALSSGGWQPTGLLENVNTTATSPRVVFDASGNAFAAWVQGTDCIVRRYVASTSTWSDAVTLDTSNTQAAHQARVAVDRSTGNAIVSWTQSDGTAESMYVSRYTASTNTWGAPEVLENSSAAVNPGPENNAISYAGGHAAAAWLQVDGAVNSIYLSRLVNGVWTAPVVVDTSAEQALHPEVAIDSSGNVTVVWRQRDSGGDYRINARRWTNNTQTFSAVTYLDGDGDRQPRIFFDAAGNAFVLWRGNGVFARRYNVLTTQWEPQVALQTNPANSAWGGELSVDAAGNAMAVWQEHDGLAYSAYTRRYDVAAGVWGAAELVDNSNYDVDIDYNPTVAINGGEAVVAWLQKSATNTRDVYASRRVSGSWSTPRLLETREESTDELTSSIDVAGNAAILWVQADGAARSIYQSMYRSSNFVVPSGATWQSIANTLYGANSGAAGNALQAAMGGGTLTAGQFLNGFPATLNVTETVPGYYTVLATDTWSHVARTVYGITDVNAIAQLRSLLGNPTLTAGLQLVVPTTFGYTESASFSAPLTWSLVNTTSTNYYSLNPSMLTTPLDVWSAPQLLENSNTRVYGVRVAFGANGNGIAVWAQGADVFARRYVASTGTWSAAVTLDTNNNTAYNARVAIDRVTGNATVAWAQSDGTADSLYFSNYNASTNSWSVAGLIETSSSAVSQSTEYATISRVNDQVAIAWLQRDGAVDGIYFSRWVNGAWTTPAVIDTSAEAALHPEVAIDAGGNATVLWRQRDTGGDFRINARRWNNTTQSFGSVSYLDGDGDRQPRIGFDAAGNAFALWRGDGVYARRYDVATNVWGTQVQLHSATSGAWNGELAVDEQGNALATFVQYDGSVNSVYARFYSAATQSWGVATALENSANPANIDLDPTVSLVNGSGVVAWVHNDARQNVYGARLKNGVWGPATLLETRDESPSSLVSSIDANDNATVGWVQAD